MDKIQSYRNYSFRYGRYLLHMPTEISSTQNNFSLWDKWQFIVLLSRTKFAKNTIFVGNKNRHSRMNFSKFMSDYIGQVLDIITLNCYRTNEEIPSKTMLQDKYSLRICEISFP